MNPTTKLLIGAVCAFPWLTMLFLILGLSRKKKGKLVGTALVLLLCPALTGGCFSPDLTGVVFLCNAANQQCGSGYTCNIDAGVCKVSGDESAPDLSQTADIAVPVVDGCTNAGRGLRLAEDVFLCPGAFSPSTIPASGLCADGWRVPAVWPANADKTICAQLPAGFALATISSYPGVMESQPACGSLSLDNRFVSACGPVDSVFPSSVNCAGLFGRFLCNGARKTNSPKCSANITSIDQLTSVTDLGGVVCKKM